MTPGLSRSYDDWKADEGDGYRSGHAGRLASERGWWHGFHVATDKEAYLADYEGIAIYKVLVEDARRRLTEAAEAIPVRVLVELDVMAGDRE